MNKSSNDTSSSEATIDDVKADLARLRTTVEALVRGRASEAQLAANDMADNLKAEGMRLIGDAEIKARENPLATLAIAFGLGFLIGSSRK